MIAKNINVMSYQELLRDVPDIEPLLKPYVPTNDDEIRYKVVKHLMSIGFVFDDYPPETRIKMRKRKHKYYLDEFGVEYKYIK